MKHIASYRPDIDGLRALAVLAVVCYHAFPPLLGGGFVGVDIFFVISGYLICGIILDDLAKGSFTLRHFYSRRINRIFPALLVVLFSVLGVGWFILLPDEYMNLGKHVAGGAGFIANIQLWKEIGYWDISANLKILLHLWSLGIEEQYYIIFPCLLFVAWKIGFRLSTLLVSLFIVSFLGNMHYYQNDPSLNFYLPFTRFWELLAGAALARASRNKSLWLQNIRLRIDSFCARVVFDKSVPNDGRCLNNALSMAGFLLLALALILARVDKNFPGLYALLPVFGAVCVISAGPGACLNHFILSNRLAVYIGLISYPLYLWHWPIISYCYILGGNLLEIWPWRFIRLGCILAALLLSFLTYRFVEIPIRFQWKNSALKISCLLTVMCCCAVFGVYVFLNKGLPDRAVVAQNKAIFEGAKGMGKGQNLDIHQNDFKKYAASFKFRTNIIYSGSMYGSLYKDAGSSRTVAVVGDSHAFVAYFGIASKNAELGLNTLYMLYNHRTHMVHPDHRQDALDFLAAKDDIRDVFIFYRGVQNITGNDLDRDSRREALLGNFKPFWQATVDKLNAQGKRVFLVSENPVLSYMPKNYITRPFALNSFAKKPPAPTKDEVLKHQAAYLSILKEIKGAIIIESIDAFCPKDRCLDILSDGQVILADDDHLSNSGSLFQAEKLLLPYLEEIAAQVKH